MSLTPNPYPLVDHSPTWFVWVDFGRSAGHATREQRHEWPLAALTSRRYFFCCYSKQPTIFWCTYCNIYYKFQGIPNKSRSQCAPKVPLDFRRRRCGSPSCAATKIPSKPWRCRSCNDTRPGKHGLDELDIYLSTPKMDGSINRYVYIIT